MCLVMRKEYNSLVWVVITAYILAAHVLGTQQRDLAPWQATSYSYSNTILLSAVQLYESLQSMSTDSIPVSDWLGSSRLSMAQSLACKLLLG